MFLACWSFGDHFQFLLPKGDSAVRLKDETACLRNCTERKFRWLSLGQPDNKFLWGKDNTAPGVMHICLMHQLVVPLGRGTRPCQVAAWGTLACIPES